MSSVKLISPGMVSAKNNVKSHYNNKSHNLWFFHLNNLPSQVFIFFQFQRFNWAGVHNFWLFCNILFFNMLLRLVLFFNRNDFISLFFLWKLFSANWNHIAVSVTVSKKNAAEVRFRVRWSLESMLWQLCQANTLTCGQSRRVSSCRFDSFFSNDFFLLVFTFHVSISMIIPLNLRILKKHSL